MQLYIAADHGGYVLKDQIKKFLLQSDILPIDLGADQLVPDDDYPDYAFALATKIANNPEAMGILICRTGVGVCIAANKVKGVYAALCFTHKHALKAREHNNANVLCLDADYLDTQLHLSLVKTFIETKFAGKESRHGRRVGKIMQYENEHMK